MMGFVDAAVPFVMVGNKSALTDQQIAEEPQWMDFIRAFKRSFQRDDECCCWYFMPSATSSRPLSDRHAVGE
jgi:hypothetical protein